MAWKQVKNFDVNKMGKVAGMCLKNVRLGFDVPAKYADAKQAMEANKKAGTLHDVKDLPTNVSVPIFVDTTSPYEHVIVSDKGTFYSDGKRLTSLNGLKCFGWAEFLNGVRIVEFVEDPKPTPAPKPAEPVKPATEDWTGKKAVPTKLVDVNGTHLVRYDDVYEVTQDAGDQVVLSARGQVWARLYKKDARLV